MSKPIPPQPPQLPKQGSAEPAPARKSGRVNFDERGQAIWEWAVETGMFDRNATSQRVRALSESAMQLEVTEAPTPAKTSATVAIPRRGDALSPYDRAEKPATAPARKAAPAKPPRDTAGSDPYSRGPAKSPEAMTFNPYEQTPTRRR